MLLAWQRGQTRDIHADMANLTMEIAAQTFLGASMTGQADRVSHVLDVGMQYFAGPVVWLPWLRRLPTPSNLRFRRARRELDAIMYATIARRRAAGEPAGDDLLSRLLAARDEDGSRMTDEQLRDELVTLFLAGHETTALALSYSLYLLAQHPDVAARLSAEVDEILQGQPPASDDVSRLRYTVRVVKVA